MKTHLFKIWDLIKNFGLFNYIVLFFILLWDLALYFILALAAMDYEDHYSPEDGPWYSLESMSNMHVAIYSGLILWILTNVFLAIYIILRITKRLKN